MNTTSKLNTNQTKSVSNGTRLNIQTLIWTFGILGVASVAFYFWHDYARKAVSRSLLEQAQQAIALGESSEGSVSTAESNALAIEKLGSYLALNPEDHEARVLLADTFHDSELAADNPERNIRLQVNALSVASGNQRANLSLRLAKLFNSLGRYSDARKFSEELVLHQLTLRPDKPFRAEAYEQLALAISGQLRFSSDPALISTVGEQPVGAILAQAIELNPDNVELPVSLANIYRDSKQRVFLSEEQRKVFESAVMVDQAAEQIADRLAADMVARNPENAQAYLTSYLYKRVFQIADADTDLMTALQIDPDNPQVNYLVGRLLLDEAAGAARMEQPSSQEVNEKINKNLLAAQAHFERAIENEPLLLEAYSKLGEVYQRLGRNDDAIEVWKQGLKKGNEIVFYQQLIAALIRSANEDHQVEARLMLANMHDLIDERARSANVDPQTLRQWSQSLHYLTALMHFRQEEFGEATQILDQIVANGADLPDTFVDSARALLGEINMRFGRLAEAAAQFESLSGAQAGDQALLMRTASLYSKNGNYDEASSIYRRVARASNSTEAWQQLAFSLYQQQMKLPKPHRDWSEFDRAIDNARKTSRETDDAEEGLVEYLVEILATIQRTENPNIQSLAAPIEKLTKLSKHYPEASRQLAFVYNQLGDHEKSDKWFETLAQQLKSDLAPSGLNAASAKSTVNPEASKSALAILQAGLFCERGDFNQADRILQLAIAESEPTQSSTIELKLAAINVLLQQAEIDTAFKRMRQLVDENPSNGRLLFDFIELAIRLRKIGPEPADWESQLNKFETAAGKYTKFLQAYRLLNRAKQAADSQSKIQLLESANQIRIEVTRQFSNWPLLNVLAGDIYFARHEAELNAAEKTPQWIAGLLDHAKYFYQQAAQSGERETRILLRLAFLESDSHESNKWIEMIDSANRNERVVGTQLQLAFRNSDLEEARRLAAVATELSPEEPFGWIRRALICWNLGEIDEADEFANKATELLNDSIALKPWQSLFNYRAQAAASAQSAQVREQQLIAAKQIIPKIVELTAQPGRKLIEAQLLAAIDDPTAAKLFLEAESLAPNDVQVLEAIVDYFSASGRIAAGALDQSIRAIEKLVELKPNEGRYRERLAKLLAMRGLESDWRKLASLYGTKVENSQLDSRAYAILLLQKNNVTNSERIDNLDQARRLVRKQISEPPDGSAVDWVILGEINRRWAGLTGNVEQAQIRLAEATECFENAVNSADVSLAQLYIAGTFFLEQGELVKANRLLNRLQALADGSGRLTPLPLALRSRIIAAKNDSDKEAEITGLTESFAQRVAANRSLPDLQKSRLYVALAQICDESGLHEQSVTWYRKAADENPKVNLELSRAYLESGDYRQSMGVLTENYHGAPSSSKPSFVTLIANILLTGWSVDELDETAKQELFEMARPILATARKAFPQDLRVLTSIANVRLIVQDDVDGSIEMYKQALGLAPRNALVLNNLATVLSDDSTRLQDAIDTIDRAIQLAGDKPQLLDTKAVILCKQSKLDEAEKILLDIVHAESDSRYWWHLAEVNWQRFEATENKSQAELADRHLRQAIDNGLESTVLTPGEKTRLLGLKTNLKKFRETAVSTSISHRKVNLNEAPRKQVSQLPAVQKQ